MRRIARGAPEGSADLSRPLSKQRRWRTLSSRMRAPIHSPSGAQRP